MKKFDQPFNSYALSSPKLSAVELAPELGYYIELSKNPIYYYHAFQYMRGSLYRAILGYENFWDTKEEEKLIVILDYFLDHIAKRKEYYIEEIDFVYPVQLKGIKWQRGIKPRVNFSMLFPKFVKARTRATARVNLLDKPNHVDLEFDDGEIFSVSYIYYLRWKRKHVRSLDHEESSRRNETSTKPDGANAKGSERREAPKAYWIGPKKPARGLDGQMLDLQEALSRITPLRKTYPKI